MVLLLYIRVSFNYYIYNSIFQTISKHIYKYETLFINILVE